MKTLPRLLLLTLSLLEMASTSLAQGQFVFGNFNRLAGIDAPLWVAAPKKDYCVKAEGNAWLAQAYLGLTLDSLSPVSSPVSFRTGVGAGYITSHVVTVPYPGGTQVWAEMRAWEAAGGDSYEAAVLAGKLFGRSNPIQLTLGEAPNVPSDMVGLQAFQAWPCIPEPSPLALSLLGGLMLLVRRRG